MAEDGLLHTAELLKTALPYVDIKSRLTLDFIVKLYDLIICMQNLRTQDVSACGLENEKVDIETLLNKIRPKCNDNERPFVDKILNIFQAKRTFEMYNTYMEAMKTMQGFDGFNGNNSSEESSEFNESDVENDTSQSPNIKDPINSFKDFDLSTIFASSTTKINNTDNPDNNDHIDSTDDFNNSNNTDNTDNTDSTHNTNDTDYTDNNNKTTSNSMIESLMAMIPPDQLESFENLRMLFDSMSYDDNNKSDENE